MDRFSGHYDPWRQKRIDAIVAHYGADFFRGKTLLELGCGYGDIGQAFYELGADVTCLDARQEHLDVVAERHPHLKTICSDLDGPWMHGAYDIVVHLGVLYHLQEIEQNLRDVCHYGKHLILETEVCDADDPYFLLDVAEDEIDAYDQSLSGRAYRPSTAFIERVLESCGMRFERLQNEHCDTDQHIYNWASPRALVWHHGLRRFWFAEQHELKPVPQDGEMKLPTISVLTRTDEIRPISFIVQGAVDRSEEGTRAACASIREHFPNGEIILSTWEGQDVSDIDCDEVVFSEDPGAVCVAGHVNNVNRQIVGAMAGLGRTSHELVIRSRADLSFTSNAVAPYFNRWCSYQTDELRIFEHRILTPNIFCRKPSYLTPLPLHPSDWCMMGMKEDLLYLYDVPLLRPEEATHVASTDELARTYWYAPLYPRYMPEQYLWNAALRKALGYDVLEHLMDFNPDTLRATELSFANNLVILDAYRQFGLHCPKYPDANRLFVDRTLYQFEDWKTLYEHYCVSGEPSRAEATLPELMPSADEVYHWDPLGQELQNLHGAGMLWESMLAWTLVNGAGLRRDATLGGDRKQTDLQLMLLADSRLRQQMKAFELKDKLASLEHRPGALNKEETQFKAQAAQSLAGLTSRSYRHYAPAAELTSIAGKPELIRLKHDQLEAYPAGRHQVYLASPPKVTVCVPVYNAAGTIRRCLESLTPDRHSGIDFRVIIVDNQSTDGTFEAVCAFADRHEHVIVYRNSANIGRIENWNRCLDLAQGKYVKLLMAPDWLLPGGLNALAGAMERHPNVVMARSSVSYLHDKGKTSFHPLFGSSRVLPGSATIRICMEKQNITNSPSAQLMRRSVLERYGLRYATDMPWAADFDLALRLLEHGHFAYVRGQHFMFDMTGNRFHASTDVVTKFKDECRGRLGVLNRMSDPAHDAGLAHRRLTQLFRTFIRQAGSLEAKRMLAKVFEDTENQLKALKAFSVAGGDGHAGMLPLLQTFQELAAQQDWTAAKRIATTAIQQFPDASYAWVLRSMSERQLGNHVEAYQALESAFKLGESPEMLLELAQLALATGNTSQAQTIADRIQQEYPEWARHYKEAGTLSPAAVA